MTQLSLVDGHLIGAADMGDLFAVDPHDGHVRRRRQIAVEDGFRRPGEQLVAHRGDVYCLTGKDLLRIDPVTFAEELIVADLDPAVPMLTITLMTAYTLANRDLLRLSLDA